MRTGTRAPGRLAIVGLLALLAFAGTAAPVGAWANRGDGYGTHDWILDQALRLLDARGINHDWVNQAVALAATDDPDTVEVAADETRRAEHVFRAPGTRGGAVHRITEHYAKILRLHDDHRFKRASRELGLLAHFWGDISMPYHTERLGKAWPDEHHAYERLVNDLTRRPTDMRAWSVARTDWAVRSVPDVRAAAIELAAFSRARFPAIHDSLEATDTTLSEVARATTGELLIQASGGLADLIRSVRRGVGNPPPVGSLELWTKWRGVEGNGLNQVMYGRVRDVNGMPIEGVRVDVTFPTADGAATLPFWTDETGEGRVRIEVAEPPLMTRVTVSASVRTDRTSVTDRDWYYRTERLADDSAGFWTEVSDRSVAEGQEVVVTTHARTVDGAPMAGLLVDWTWMLGDPAMVTTGYTNADGVATTRFVVTDATTDEQVYVYAHTSAFSINRRSKTWFQLAGEAAGPR